MYCLARLEADWYDVCGFQTLEVEILVHEMHYVAQTQRSAKQDSNVHPSTHPIRMKSICIQFRERNHLSHYSTQPAKTHCEPHYEF
ncbi:hypothetical protein VTL71DRAFT_13719 [Oculimacula yallundae]|uniref:Uncharacterized protein n=1 Tax=Oculimacula yallundae TaxID=86028 RepID=A0ABR4CL95_9HELO